MADLLRLQAGKADEVGTETEPSALTGGEANARGHQIQEGEGDGGDNGNGQDLLHIQLLLGDDEGRQRNGQTLQEILNGTGDELGNGEAIHLIL